MPRDRNILNVLVEKLLCMEHFEICILKLILIRRRGVVGRVPAFQPGGPGSIPGWVRNFNLSWDWVCVLCVLSCVVFGGGPDLVLTTHSGRPALVYLSSVLVHSLLLILQAYDQGEFGL